MPPNKKGGKGYKKGKHGSEDVKMIEWDSGQGQMLGRVLKSLGQRRFQVFCNDNKERICKLCGSTRKSEWVDTGAIVLIGIRSLGMATSRVGDEVGDILNLVDTQLYGKIKKMEGVNLIIFSHIENEDVNELRRKIKAQEDGEEIDDDLFDRGDSDESEDSESEDGKTGEERKKEKAASRELKQKAQTQKISEARAKKTATANENGDLDIDAI